MLRQGKKIREIVEATNISKSTVGKYRKVYERKGDSVFRELEETGSAGENKDPHAYYTQWKKKNGAQYTWEGFEKEWNRTVRSILGICIPPERFAEDWMEAVNRIRKFYGLKELMM